MEEKKNSTPPYRVIVAGFDGSEASLKAVMRAAELASSLGADLHIIAVVPPPTVILGPMMAPELLDVAPLAEAARKALEKVAEEIKGWHGARAFVDVVMGNPAEEILRYSESVGANLIVVGSSGARGAALLGSVAHEVVKHAKVDVLVVEEADKRGTELSGGGENE